MSEVIFRSSRTFELWRYTVSHSQLLLRSNKGSGANTRLEILFKNVGYMATPVLMNSIIIATCDAKSDPFLESLPNLQGLRTWFRIETNGAKGYVAAAAIITSEDELDYEQPSTILVAPNF